jgi:hypothetical protein
VKRIKLTAAQVDAYDLAKANGGILVKHRGGFWAPTGWTYLKPYASSPTVMALVKVGAAEVTKSKTDFFKRTYPQEITIKPLAP